MTDKDDDRTPERKRLDAWTAANPRDEMALALFAAWVNCSVDELPATMRGHTCPATMAAWERVADAASLYMQPRVTMERLVAALKAQIDHPDFLFSPYVDCDIYGEAILDGSFDLNKLVRDLNDET
jgi:hypothetical protein